MRLRVKDGVPNRTAGALRTGKLAAAVLALTLPNGIGVAAARPQRQNGRGFGGGSNAPIAPNISYDGRFTFIRVRYGPPISHQTQRAGWSHDYPDGEQN